jgi:hypothetical protein
MNSTAFHRLVALLALAAVLLLAGCASEEGGGSPGAAPEPTPSLRATPRPAPVPSSPSVPPPASGPSVTVTGTVTDGVEAGCRILTDDKGGGSYLLLGGDRAVLAAGRKVEVTGAVVSGIMTTCQQGRPLRVISAKPA